MIPREPRYRIEIQVDCSTRDVFTANRVSNISRGGVFIETRLPLDSEVDLLFRLPEDPQVTIGAKGRVAWTCDMKKKGSTQLLMGSGIRFTEIDAGHRALLVSYLEKLEGSEAKPAVAAAPTASTDARP